ncbi:8982_t:CDS:2 [Entrophospora sp. SA101]|nr:19997_t:CDS:2 [Entrophospora sp. SA101]CAJ0766065.1 8982_t:CDS:2 [Entrophospora sp. SA101]CAJ0914738.1 4474_t:CDS:2 [Entrophospora sp. SA101]CAJ0914754.1 4478_t:CDS:2 [Entrophospora sp. SA101]
MLFERFEIRYDETFKDNINKFTGELESYLNQFYKADNNSIKRIFKLSDQQYQPRLFEYNTSRILDGRTEESYDIDENLKTDFNLSINNNDDGGGSSNDSDSHHVYQKKIWCDSGNSMLSEDILNNKGKYTERISDELTSCSSRKLDDYSPKSKELKGLFNTDELNNSLIEIENNIGTKYPAIIIEALDTLTANDANEEDERKYVTNACSRCKKRHIKCDDHEPSCKNCEEKGFACKRIPPTIVRGRPLGLLNGQGKWKKKNGNNGAEKKPRQARRRRKELTKQLNKGSADSDGDSSISNIHDLAFPYTCDNNNNNNLAFGNDVQNPLNDFSNFDQFNSDFFSPQTQPGNFSNYDFDPNASLITDISINSTITTVTNTDFDPINLAINSYGGRDNSQDLEQYCNSLVHGLPAPTGLFNINIPSFTNEQYLKAAALISSTNAAINVATPTPIINNYDPLGDLSQDLAPNFNAESEKWFNENNEEITRLFQK